MLPCGLQQQHLSVYPILRYWMGVVGIRECMYYCYSTSVQDAAATKSKQIRAVFFFRTDRMKRVASVC